MNFTARRCNLNVGFFTSKICDGYHLISRRCVPIIHAVGLGRSTNLILKGGQKLVVKIHLYMSHLKVNMERPARYDFMQEAVLVWYLLAAHVSSTVDNPAVADSGETRV